MSRLRERTEADGPDALRRGDRGARQSRRWLGSEIPLGALLETPYGQVPDEAPAEGLRVRTHDVIPPGAPLPPMPWTVTRKEQVWTPRLAHLVEQANASQWNASLDIPWSAGIGLADHLEAAVCDVFTWLLQQELVAHHVPSAWLPQIHPAFLEVKLFLSGKVMDEARHAEVCVKRLWLNGAGPTATSAETDEAVAPLCLLEDYEQASLLVDILGEGQILDVFKIVYDLAPDDATRRIVLLSRRDEARHVSYGVARLKHRIETARDPEAVGRQIVEWIAARIEVSTEFFTLPDMVQEALGVLGREAGIDGRQRAREFPAEANVSRGSRQPAFRRGSSGGSETYSSQPVHHDKSTTTIEVIPIADQARRRTTTAAGDHQHFLAPERTPSQRDAINDSLTLVESGIAGVTIVWGGQQRHPQLLDGARRSRRGRGRRSSITARVPPQQSAGRQERVPQADRSALAVPA